MFGILMFPLANWSSVLGQRESSEPKEELLTVGVGVCPGVCYGDGSLKGDITRNVFVLVVECWTEEIAARPEERAQEDHHCVCEGGCAPEEGRERLEAEPEERKPN